MQLSVFERLMVQNLIPKEANYTNLKLIRVAREALSFTEEELKVLQFKEEGEGADKKMIWNNGTPDKEIALGETVTGMIATELKRLDAANKLTAEHLPIYEKFLKE
jgi:hypothetical protein